ncbi:sigma 54-interacting transcriptional regulator [Enterococcus saccharolyticus]|uniref:sigma 54-interacting transcriptional regulator n=1 Tax=Enterococcus TaxID=1350 RepID=UPI001E6080F8|nr:sigma-54-dependent transcriptional regulator [Enterococcus saccharolyticus]MCD5002666.1 sigma 54-interacting transcriptional regulator [Enterococcus saccharolyticus]
MYSRKEEILKTIELHKQGLTAAEVADMLQIDRSNASRYLSELYKEEKIHKRAGRPVIYEPLTDELVHVDTSTDVTFDTLVGANASLKVSIQQAKAAILYPPRGLHTIIFGETGTGKSMFAECMYHFAVQSKVLKRDAPFISFNCADYAQNPQLLFGHIFGIRKGAYTGATEDSPGLMAKADGGILFLDEIHRLPPEGQEMLFTFIDKGVYRPLGESAQTYEASVQIIGATTESSESFLTTFNRRIPMAITLPSLAARSLDERYEIISLFIKQEANRLNQGIQVEKDAILSFMLYDAEANIGQIKRDLKLVCAKAFLHYRTHGQKNLLIRRKDCTLQVQKGLLKVKEMSDRLDRFLEGKGDFLTFEPGASDVVWSHDPERNMQVYNDIEEKVSTLSQTGVENIDLEQLISRDVDAYFETYVEELAQTPVHKNLIPQDIWQLTNNLYDIAEKELDRKYNEKARFAFALHLQSTLDRIRDGHMIIHPDLNTVRKQLKSEFQVALDLSTYIEEECDIEIPFDEIGFISMFLSIQVGEFEPLPINKVGVIVLMHGRATASSMLETAQELLGTDTGIAMNMTLDTEVKAMYNEVLSYVYEAKDELSNGVLILTDMGSLNSFANLIYEETGIRAKAISMSSTMIVIEALRMSDAGRSLEDMYQNIQMSFETIVREQFRNVNEAKGTRKAIVVTCFTGEGVAAKLYHRIAPIVNESQVEIIQMQFIERETFKKHIDSLMEEYEIKAIAGTVEVDYQNIPFFSAYDVFDDEKLNVLRRIIGEEVSIDTIVDSLKDTLVHVRSLPALIKDLQKAVHQIQTQLHLIVEPGVEGGIVIHLAFLVESLLKGEDARVFPNLADFQKQYRLETDQIRTILMSIERNYYVRISEDEIAFLLKTFIDNRLETNQESYTQSS